MFMTGLAGDDAADDDDVVAAAGEGRRAGEGLDRPSPMPHPGADDEFSIGLRISWSISRC